MVLALGIAAFSNTQPTHNNSKLVVNSRLKTVAISAIKAIKRGAEISQLMALVIFQGPTLNPTKVWHRKTNNETPVPPNVQKNVLRSKILRFFKRFSFLEQNNFT